MGELKMAKIKTKTKYKVTLTADERNLIVKSLNHYHEKILTCEDNPTLLEKLILDFI